MGPLAGIRIVEMAGIGPGPFAAMLLADMGADVVRIERPDAHTGIAVTYDVLARGRRSVAANVKTPEGLARAKALIGKADGLIEGFRPGVMERMGLSPETCLAHNPKLVYGRMTGWGQDGPLAHAAGHDINYIALTGALHSIGTKAGGPVPPLNLIGDFGGGALYLAFGMVCALLEARSSGQGQVIDAAMTDGAAHLMTMIYGFKADGHWTNARESNFLDGGAPYYGTFECADGKWIGIGAIEPQFYALLREKIGADDHAFDAREDTASWPALREKFQAIFKSKTRAEWCERLEGTDVCFAPILDMNEAPAHSHNQARGTFVERDGVVQPAPAPRFSRTEPSIQRSPPKPGEHTAEVLSDWGIDEITGK